MKQMQRIAGDIVDALAPGAALLFLLLALSVIGMGVLSALNPPSHEGEHVMFVWDGHPIYQNDTNP